MRSRNSSKSSGTQFLHISSLMQLIAMTPSRARSAWPTICPVLPWPALPLARRLLGEESPFEVGGGLVLTGSWQPKRAKWKMEANRAGVMEEDKGIQLNRWAKHSRASRHSVPLSDSSPTGVLSPTSTPIKPDTSTVRNTKGWVIWPKISLQLIFPYIIHWLY